MTDPARASLEALIAKWREEATAPEPDSYCEAVNTMLKICADEFEAALSLLGEPETPAQEGRFVTWEEMVAAHERDQACQPAAEIPRVPGERWSNSTWLGFNSPSADSPVSGGTEK